GKVIPPRAGLPEGGQGAHNQPGVLFAERGIIEPQRRQEAWPEGLQNDVRRRRQKFKKPSAGGSLQVEGNPALGGIVVPEGQTALRVREVVEERSHPAAGLAAGGFDLDHIGSEIAQKLAAELAFFVRELEDPQARQRARQVLGVGPWSIARRSISSI